PIRIVHIECSTKRLPIAKARNIGARESSYDKLFFLDVDCIPDRSYFEQMATYFKDDRVLMGTPHYLPKNPGDIKHIHEKAIAHPHRPLLIEPRKEPDYNMFWSLCFAMSRKSFESIAGFDEGFLGYGGEDTDFAWKLKDAELELWLINAKVYHQQHPVSVPPLGHLEAIVDNSNYFYNKRGFWIMESWLQDFNEMGLIDWNPNTEKINIVRQPTSQEKENAYREDALFM
ncbi:MAG TPA: galactosyltransferase-related protein, partial [Anditalea sp.]|nr:galactosyltransferase-related protein [Anditalea sp.]